MRRRLLTQVNHPVFSPQIFSQKCLSTILPSINMILLCLGVAFIFCGCEENRDPQTPDGALRLFGVALAENNQQLINESLSSQTHQKLDELLKLTRQIRTNVKRFPSPKAQGWARKEALGTLAEPLKSVSNAEQLLQLLIKDKLSWAKTQPEGEVEQGLSSQEMKPGKTDQEMIIITRADDEVLMRKETQAEGERWVVCVFEPQLDLYINTFKTSIQRLEDNRAEWLRRKKLNLPLPESETP